jgi:hypothetical protein
MIYVDDTVYNKKHPSCVSRSAVAEEGWEKPVTVLI